MSCECNEKLPDPVIHEFNYENAKITFNQELEYVLKEKNIINKVVPKMTDIDKIIQDKKQNRLKYKLYFSLKCQIVNENGKDILCQVKMNVDNKTPKLGAVQQFVSLDVLFDIMSELHMKDPSLYEEEIFNHLSNCVVPMPLIRLFRKSCETCIFLSTMRNLHPNYKIYCEMTIFKLDLPDGQFTNILLYVERNTNFVLLRPLQSVSDNELAYELATIFSDFGAPTYMSLKNFTYKRYNRILNILMSVELPFKVPKKLASNRKHKVILTTTRAKQMLLDWMKETGSTNWAIGAHIVQWRMNTSNVFDSYIRSEVVSGPISSPYHAMFGLLPRTHLVQIKTKPQCGPMLKRDKVLVDCSQCHQPIYKQFKCYFCKGLCHFSCCIRYVDQVVEMPILVNKCLSCVNSDISGKEIILGT